MEYRGKLVPVGHIAVYLCMASKGAVWCGRFGAIPGAGLLELFLDKK